MAKAKKEKKQKLQPIQDWVLVKPLAPETQTEAGIIIPETAIEKQLRGDIIAVGPGKKDEPMTVKAGDRVIYRKHAGMEVEYENEAHLLMKENEILAII